MKVGKRIVLKIVIGLLVAFVLSLLFLFLNFIRVWNSEGKELLQRKVHLVSNTDHQALLEACREIGKANLTLSRFSVRPEPDPKISPLPQLILDIEPLFIETTPDGRVRLGLCGGLHHVGVTAYPENYKEPSPGFKYGDKKIIDGLWYYEDGYNSKSDEWIEALLQRGKTSTLGT